MNTTALKIDGLNKSYPGNTVLTSIDLDISAGEYFGLVGINGTGKTTLIKSILDFCQIDSGSIQIFGNPHQQTSSRNNLAYLPERFIPPHYLTGREYLRYMDQLHGIDYDRAEVEAVFQHLGLDISSLSNPVRAYSKGMAQKLGLAACFLSNKPLLILDEPMSGLDPKARALFKKYLLARKDKQQTVFFTTHLLHDVETLCDRLAILHQGELCFIGTPHECCECYQAANLEQAFLNAIDAENMAQPAA